MAPENLIALQPSLPLSFWPWSPHPSRYQRPRLAHLGRCQAANSLGRAQRGPTWRRVSYTTNRSRLEAAAEAMNWKRGLLRMWLLLSVLWAAFCVALVFIGDGSAVLVAFAILPFALFLLGMVCFGPRAASGQRYELEARTFPAMAGRHCALGWSLDSTRLESGHIIGRKFSFLPGGPYPFSVGASNRQMLHQRASGSNFPLPRRAAQSPSRHRDSASFAQALVGMAPETPAPCPMPYIVSSPAAHRSSSALKAFHAAHSRPRYLVVCGCPRELAQSWRQPLLVCVSRPTRMFRG